MPTASAAPLAAPPQRGPVIDGSITPEKIPDYVAYSLVFRMIANRRSESAARSIRAYVSQLGVGEKKCIACSKAGARPEAVAPDPQIEAVVAAAEEYQRQVSALDMQAKAIKDATWRNPTPEARAELANLQQQKIALVNSVVASLEQKLGPAAAASLRQHVNERVKRRTQIRLSEATQ